MRLIRSSAAILGGFIVWALAASVAFRIMQFSWADYAAAVPTKDYSLLMLILRLGIAAGATALAGLVATLVARDRGLAASLCGGVLLAVSLRPHLVTVWDDYPVWYHVTYLSYLVPIAWLAGRAASTATRSLPAGNPRHSEREVSSPEVTSRAPQADLGLGHEKDPSGSDPTPPGAAPAELRSQVH